MGFVVQSKANGEKLLDYFRIGFDFCVLILSARRFCTTDRWICMIF